jgi:hypothetical protein
MAGHSKLIQVNILFRMGFGLEARLIKQKGKGVWTHVGILISGNIFESVPDGENQNGGVIKSRPETFWSREKASQTAFVTFFLDPQQEEKLSEWCELCCLKRLPFDNTYDLSCDDKMYCSEFVYKAFRQIGILLCNGPLAEICIPFSGKKKIIFPSDLVGLQPLHFGIPFSRS